MMRGEMVPGRQPETHGSMNFAPTNYGDLFIV